MDIRDTGKAPVSPESPAGADPSYEPEFEQLQAEIDKLSMPTASGQGIDWDKVTTLSQTILTAKGKHLPTAAYMAVALLRLRALEGLADGVTILADVTTTYWDSLYPPKNRMRGRANALSWFRDQVQVFFDGFTSDATFPKDVVDRLTSGFGSLADFVSDNVPDGPGFRDLLGMVSRLPVDAPPPPPEPVPAPEQSTTQPAAQATPKPAPQPAPRPAPAPAAQTDDQDAAASLETVLRQMTGVAGQLLAQDPGDPRAYALCRMGAWLRVGGLPPAEQGQTMIPPPDETIKGSIGQLLASRQYADALRQAESQVPVFLFWLDLTRLSAQALDGLGAPGQDALETLKALTSLYVERHKGLEAMSFSDGTPFADQETKTWLKTLSRGAGPVLDAGGEDSPLAAAVGEATALAAGKKFVEAVTRLQDALRQVRSGRERFDGLIALAGMLAQSGRADLAGPNIDELLELVERYKLEQWEPDTALRGLLAAYDVLSLDTSDEGKARTRQVLSRVARINPAAAMRVSGP